MKNVYQKFTFLPLFVLILLANISWGQEVVNTEFGPATGVFTLEFDVVPSHSPMNGGVGLSNGDVGTWGDMSCIIGFHKEGLLTAYNNGSGYEKMNDITYAAGTKYHFAMTVDVPNQTYTVDVTPDGGATTNLATDYAFRKEVTSLTNYASYNDTNTDFGGVPGATMDITEYVFTAGPSSTTILKTDNAPMIDGNIDDWADIPANDLMNRTQGAGGDGSDFTGYWKGVWTDTGLTFMAEITEDTLYNAGSALWNHDAVNFYIGLNGANGLGASNDSLKNFFYYWWAPGDESEIKSADEAITPGEAKKWDTDNGYAIEWTITYEELNKYGYDITFEEGTSFQFDVVAVDDDDEVDDYTVWSWSTGGGGNYGDMDKAGTLTLALPIVETAATQIMLTDTPPTIDGNIDDWANIPENALGNRTQGAGGDGSDFTGYWKGVWTDTGLTFMAEITEDTLYNAGSALWNHDAVNFYIGLNDRNDLGASNDSLKNFFYYWWAPGDDSEIKSADEAITPGEAKKWDTDNGYAIEWTITFEELNKYGYDIDFKDGTSFLFDVVAVDDDDEEDDYTVWSWSTGGGGNYGNMNKAGEVTLKIPTSTTNIMKTTAAPAIDGNIDDWANIPENALGFRTQGAGGDGSDFTGYWKGVWTDTGLTFMAEITEDTLYNAGSALWNHDAVNFYIGLNDRNDLGASNDSLKNFFYYWWAPGDDSEIKSADAAITPGEAKKWDTDNGYAIEWTITFEELNKYGYDIEFKDGTSFLFDVVAVDDDDEEDDYTVWAWSTGGGGNYGNMNNAGEVTLKIATSTTNIMQTETPPAIDGNLDDWANIPENALGFRTQGFGGDGSDFAGYWKAVWTNDELFMMAEITEDTLYNAGSALWNHDAVNFYFGLNDRNGLGASNDDNKYLYHYWWAPGDDSNIGGIKDDPTRVKKWDKADGTGYVIEWKISFADLNAAGYDIEFKDGTSFLFDVVAVDDDDEEDDYTVWSWSTGGGGNFGNMDNAGLVTLKIPTMNTVIHKATTPPAIDGNSDDWQGIPENALGFRTQGAGGDGSDFAGFWKAVWTDTELFMMADITEDTLYNAGSALWNHDAVNFYIGLNDRNGLGASNDDHKYLYHYWWAPGDNSTIGGIVDDPTRVRKWDKADGTGYVIEWKISFADLNANGFDIDFNDGTSFLFDVVAVDDDDEEDDYTVWSWSTGGGGNFGNMDNAGLVTLSGPVANEDIHNRATFNVSPNPAKSNIFVNGFNNINSLEIYNLQGQKVFTKSISKNTTEVNIDIHTFNSGAYVLRLVGDKNYSARMIIKK